MALHLEFYWVPAQGSLAYCESITLNTTSIEHAMAHAKGMLANHTFALGKANLCLIKDAEGRLLHEVRALPVPPVNTGGD